MTWFRQATSHHLNQCWLRWMSSYVVMMPQWVNRLRFDYDGRHFADEIFKCNYLGKKLYFDSNFTEICLQSFNWQYVSISSGNSLVPNWWQNITRTSGDPVHWRIIHAITTQCVNLTHWGREKMDAISQTTFWSAFSWMKIFELRLKFHWSLFLRVQLTIFQHWFR